MLTRSIVHDEASKDRRAALSSHQASRRYRAATNDCRYPGNGNQRVIAMVSEQTRMIASKAAEDLRRRGEDERARAIEALLAATGEQTTPSVDAARTEEMPDLLGATGQEIMRWIREGRYTAYRIGNQIIPADTVKEYVGRARRSLELPDLPDEEAARLVIEGRTPR
jgi:excisionase family DNA binding protein